MVSVPWSQPDASLLDTRVIVSAQAPTTIPSINANQVALLTARGEISAARAEKISFQEAADGLKTEAARKDAEVEELRWDSQALLGCLREPTRCRDTHRSIPARSWHL